MTFFRNSPISAHFYPPLHHNGKGSIRDVIVCVCVCVCVCVLCLCVYLVEDVSRHV